MNKQKLLGQFYTPDDIARFSVRETLSHCEAGALVAIELSAGQGNLLSALQLYRPKSKLVAVDIDSENYNYLKKIFPEAKVLCEDGIGELNSIEDSSFDLALGNPPFINLECITEFHRGLVENVFGPEFKIGKKIRAEIVFFSQYLRLLKNDGILTIILPDSIVSGVRHEAFRSALIKNYQILSVSEIIGSSFSRTEAKTHVLIISKSIPDEKLITVNRINSQGECVESIAVEKYKMNSRMDYSFHRNSIKINKHCLSDYADVSRGNLTHKDLKGVKKYYLHTTNIDSANELEISSEIKILDNYIYAEKGDLIMCRVGSRGVGRMIEYKNERVLLSDCLFRIRFKNKKLCKKFYKFYSSLEGKVHIDALTRGVCSRYLTKGDLLSLLF
jgi:hypothetical protein